MKKNIKNKVQNSSSWLNRKTINRTWKGYHQSIERQIKRQILNAGIENILLTGNNNSIKNWLFSLVTTKAEEKANDTIGSAKTSKTVYPEFYTQNI